MVHIEFALINGLYVRGRRKMQVIIQLIIQPVASCKTKTVAAHAPVILPTTTMQSSQPITSSAMARKKLLVYQFVMLLVTDKISKRTNILL